MENHHLEWIFPSTMVIFHSYVKLPEGSFKMFQVAAQPVDLPISPRDGCGLGMHSRTLVRSPG